MSNLDGIDADLRPPCTFIAGTVKFAVMAPAKRCHEFIAHLAAWRAWLREAKFRVGAPQRMASVCLELAKRSHRVVLPSAIEGGKGKLPYEPPPASLRSSTDVSVVGG
jgi:hypothetical protein